MRRPVWSCLLPVVLAIAALLSPVFFMSHILLRAELQWLLSAGL